MTHRAEHSEARERVLAAAERLFSTKGYAAVTLRDIAAAIGIRQASLYHHVPGGKEELFIEVTERTLARHHAGLDAAIRSAPEQIRDQLRAAAAWLLAQPPMDLLRMMHSDMPAIAEAHAQRLGMLAYDSLIQPLEAAIAAACARGEIVHQTPGLVAGGLLGMLQSLHAIPDYALDGPREALAYALIDVLLQGLCPR